MRNVLITGGTGYFGQGLVRHLLKYDVYERICIYSRDEAKQAAMRAHIADPHERLRWFVGDVRDLQRLTQAMQGIDLVIHAAALKRVEVGEYNPAEMVKTNVLGTMNVIEAANTAKMRSMAPVGSRRRVVALSTDKACHPINAYGASKLMMEKLILGANNASGQDGPTFAVTRYGNVAGSTGSVIPTWRAALERKQTINISNLMATRFWMTLEEAIDLVMKTAWTNTETFVTPELPAYDLHTLKTAMHIIDYQVTGLGKGEKLHEQMLENGPDSSNVRAMTVSQLREALQRIE